jgi:hypothetical protein
MFRFSNGKAVGNLMLKNKTPTLSQEVKFPHLSRVSKGLQPVFTSSHESNKVKQNGKKYVTHINLLESRNDDLLQGRSSSVVGLTDMDIIQFNSNNYNVLNATKNQNRMKAAPLDIIRNKFQTIKREKIKRNKANKVIEDKRNSA